MKRRVPKAPPPATAGDYHHEYEDMLAAVKRHEDPWDGYGRSVQGYTVYFMAKYPLLTPEHCANLATEMLASMCAADV